VLGSRELHSTASKLTLNEIMFEIPDRNNSSKLFRGA
jgi:hypothetical protein